MKYMVIPTDLTPDQQRRVLIMHLNTIWTSPLGAIGEHEAVYYKDRATSKEWEKEKYRHTDLDCKEHIVPLCTSVPIDLGDMVILRHGDNQCTIIHAGLDEADIRSTFRSSVIRNMVEPQYEGDTDGCTRRSN